MSICSAIFMFISAFFFLRISTALFIATYYVTYIALLNYHSSSVVLPFLLQDVIAAVPPHWNEGLKEDHGSRWAGQVLYILRREISLVINQFLIILYLLLNLISLALTNGCFSDWNCFLGLYF